jgi:hypothetical protein
MTRKLSITSTTFPDDRLAKILSTPGTYHKFGHFEYPVSEAGKVGNHLDALFLIDPIAKRSDFIDWIVEDINRWLNREGIACNLIFAPAQPAVKSIVDKLAAMRGISVAYWDYHPSGWFGDNLAAGNVQERDKVFVFNAVSHTGRCVGERLAGFVEKLGGEVNAAGVFALGTSDGATLAKQRYGTNLYTTVEVPLNLYSATNCPICVSNRESPNAEMNLIPWTAVEDSFGYQSQSK